MKKILIGFLLASAFEASAQLVNNGQIISVSNRTPVIVDGGIQNRAGGSIINNGLIVLTGSWDNSGTYTSDSGTVRLVSNNVQRIRNNGNTFYNIDFMGSGAKIVQDETRVSNQLSLDSSLVNTRDPNAVLIISSGAQILNFSANAYINGFLYHEGTGRKEYPIGSRTQYLPVILENVAGTDPITGVGMIEPNSNTEISGELTMVSAQRYWDIDIFSGNFQGSQITLPIGNDESIATNQADLVVGQAGDLTTPFASLGQSNISRGAANPFVTSEDLVTGGSIVALAIRGNLGEESIFVPSALSPTASGGEDNVIKVYGDTISPNDFLFRIYDRWGQMVYESNDLSAMQTTGWTGVNQDSGKLVKLDVYTYSLKGTFLNGNTFSKTGSITMLR